MGRWEERYPNWSLLVAFVLYGKSCSARALHGYRPLVVGIYITGLSTRAPSTMHAPCLFLSLSFSVSRKRHEHVRDIRVVNTRTRLAGYFTSCSNTYVSCHRGRYDPSKCMIDPAMSPLISPAKNKVRLAIS